MDKNIPASLGEHLKHLRSSANITLNELSQKSGVSRSTLSRIENGEVSPTAETLGQLASALEMPISQLLLPLEPEFDSCIRSSEQNVWVDAVHGLRRKNVSPPSKRLKIELIECEIGPYQKISYDHPAFSGHEHHLVILSGSLTIIVDGTRYALCEGDCLRYQLNNTSSFETGEQSVRYIIAMA